ncbi:MAG: homoserine dehydrogenase [Fibrobacterota bacterium]
MESIGIGIIGLGTVGSGVVEILRTRTASLSRAAGMPLELVQVAARLPSETAPFQAMGLSVTNDAMSLVENPAVKIVVEVAGGYDIPMPWYRRALELGKPVVTANKALLAKHGAEIFPLAAKHGTEIRFEASVGGAIPVIRTLRDAYSGSEASSLACIINGTTNFILSRMAKSGMDYAEALAEAQALGYAEADPTFDVEGYDAAHKVAILASLCAGKRVDFNDMHVEGISRITIADIEAAEELGCVIRLLGQVELDGDRVDARVHPCLVPHEHPLASVQGAYNAVFIDGTTAGQTLLYGKGAGRLPTASAVCADIADAARQILSGLKPLDLSWFGQGNATLRPLSEAQGRYYLRLAVQDRPGVLGQIATILGEEGVSVAEMIQHEADESGKCAMIFHTHAANEDAVQRAIARIDALSDSAGSSVVLRFYDRGLEE